MAKIYLSIGSNIDAEHNVCVCMQRLQQDFQAVRFSAIYRTSAVGFQGEPFLNLAAELESTLAPTELQQYLKTLEKQHGRNHNAAKFSARSLDIDLLLYEQLNLQPQHNLPHKDILQYAFVLYPLLELAPDYIHPEYNQTLSHLAASAPLNRDDMQQVQLAC